MDDAEILPVHKVPTVAMISPYIMGRRLFAYFHVPLRSFSDFGPPVSLVRNDPTLDKLYLRPGRKLSALLSAIIHPIALARNPRSVNSFLHYSPRQKSLFTNHYLSSKVKMLLNPIRRSDRCRFLA